MALTRNILYYGSDAPPPEPIMLRAGPLSLAFIAGEIRDIRIGRREVLRRIYMAVRDRNWRRVPAFVHDFRHTIGPESFDLKFTVENKQAEIAFQWDGSIVGESNGTISFNMEGTARSTFWKNRIGFCVLHSSAELAGFNCSIETVDGEQHDGKFPRYISPHQVFSKIRAISHEIIPGLLAEVRLEGNVYEMEDQRNWSDASYKTYCPPLSLPFPAEIVTGSTVSQAITLAVKGSVSNINTEPADKPIVIELGETSSVLPRIGLGLAPGPGPLSSRSIDRLRTLHLTHLRVDLRLNDGAYESQLQRATNEASRLGLTLEVALFLTDNAQHEIQELRSALNRARPPLATWLVFHVSEKSTSQKWLNMARAGLSDYDTEALFGGGTDANFAELNRCRPPASGIDLVNFPLNPQVHAFDHANLIENLQSHASMVESLRHFADEARVSVSPVTLRPRPNPAAMSSAKNPEKGDLPAWVDPRQMSLLGAVWTACTLKNLAEAGIYSTTFYETGGWNGVMDADQSSVRREIFPCPSGAVFPLYHLLADVGEFQGGSAVVCSSTAPLKAQGLALAKDNRLRFVLVNTTPEQQTIRLIPDAPSSRFEMKVLDESTAEWAMTDPQAFRSASGNVFTAAGEFADIQLAPLALTRLDRI